MKNAKVPDQFESECGITPIDRTPLNSNSFSPSIPEEVMEILLDWQYIEINPLNNSSNQSLEIEQLASFFSSQSYQFPASLLNSFSDSIIIADQHGSVQFINRSAQLLTGWEQDCIKSLSVQQIFYGELFSKDSCQQYILPQNDSELGYKRSVANLQVSDQTVLPIEYNAFILHQECDTLIGFIIVFRSALKNDNFLDRSADTSIHDPLTGLINRSHFDFLLNKALIDCKTANQQHVLCYIDIDWFKIVNETCGSKAGDMIIRQVSKLLAKRVRSSDVLSRLSADQFVLILYGCKLEKALEVVDSIRQEVKGFKFAWNDKYVSCTISVGVVELDEKSNNSSHVLGTASMACNIAKSNGRDRVYVSSASDGRLDIQRNEYSFTFNIYNALENNDFVLFHQPIAFLSSIEVDNLNPEIHSYEILLRLSHQDSLISPIHFIPLAEKYGLMHLLDRQVIRLCFSSISESYNSPNAFCSKLYKPELISINISGSSLNDDLFYDFLLEQFSLFNVSPESICFEITESAAIKNLYNTKLLITRLRDLGCSFALDDFGIGMSSFEYLRNLPVNYLKIDGSFVKEIHLNQVQCEIVEAINRVAHVMGIKTIAEYVESHEIVSKLSSIGVDYVQGYYIGKPVPFDKYSLSVEMAKNAQINASTNQMG